MNCELGLYEGFLTIADLGFLISEIKEKHLCFLQNTEGYSSEIQHPISEIIGNPSYTTSIQSSFWAVSNPRGYHTSLQIRLLFHTLLVLVLLRF